MSNLLLFSKIITAFLSKGFEIISSFNLDNKSLFLECRSLVSNDIFFIFVPDKFTIKPDQVYIKANIKDAKEFQSNKFRDTFIYFSSEDNSILHITNQYLVLCGINGTDTKVYTFSPASSEKRDNEEEKKIKRIEKDFDKLTSNSKDKSTRKLDKIKFVFKDENGEEVKEDDILQTLGNPDIDSIYVTTKEGKKLMVSNLESSMDTSLKVFPSSSFHVFYLCYQFEDVMKNLSPEKIHQDNKVLLSLSNSMTSKIASEITTRLEGMKTQVQERKEEFREKRKKKQEDTSRSTSILCRTRLLAKNGKTSEAERIMKDCKVLIDDNNYDLSKDRAGYEEDMENSFLFLEAL
jgi:hypothetical protein